MCEMGEIRMKKYPFSIPYKYGKWFIVIINFASLISVFYILANNNFNTKDLKDLASFSISTILAFAALMLSIFTFKGEGKSKETEKKLKSNVIGYLMDAISASSVAVLSYVVSFMFTFPVWIIKMFATITILLIVHMLTHSVAFIAAHFDLE